ncbi:MAG: NAD(P)H-dependent flavin oxidoreductase [Candidatus Helarchaeota archaeon]
MIQTVLNDILGIKYPIIQGGMGPFNTTKLAVGVSNAGALGIISGTGIITGLGVIEDYGTTPGGKTNKQQMKDAIYYVVENTKDDTVCGINVPVPTEALGMINALFRGFIEARNENKEVERKCKVLITSAGDPSRYISKVKRKTPGVISVHVVPAPEHALVAKRAGADIIVASGHEGGAHINPRGVHTSVLLNSVIKTVPDVPVVAAGGIGDGKGLALALIMGAVGIQMGTRFIVTKESDFHQNVKETIVKAGVRDTLVTQGLIGMMRYYSNDTSRKLKEIVDKERLKTGAKDIVYGSDEISKFEFTHFINMKNGDVQNGLLPMGEIAGMINDIPTCKELIERIIKEAEEILKLRPNELLL